MSLARGSRVHGGEPAPSYNPRVSALQAVAADVAASLAGALCSPGSLYFARMLRRRPRTEIRAAAWMTGFWAIVFASSAVMLAAVGREPRTPRTAFLAALAGSTGGVATVLAIAWLYRRRSMADCEPANSDDRA